MGKRSRTKGHAFERRCARWLSELLGFKVYRQTDETQQGNVGDIRVHMWEGDPESPKLVAQCKHTQQPSIWRALDEAEEAAKEDDLPVAFVRRHGGEDVVAMRPDTFWRMFRQYFYETKDFTQPGEGWGSY